MTIKRLAVKRANILFFSSPLFFYVKQRISHEAECISRNTDTRCISIFTKSPEVLISHVAASLEDDLEQCHLGVSRIWSLVMLIKRNEDRW